MPSRTCVTPGCGNLVQRSGARCQRCRGYLKAAGERRRTDRPVDIKPLDPADTERILAAVDQAIAAINRGNSKNQVLTILYSARTAGEPWRTLRQEILRQQP